MLNKIPRFLFLTAAYVLAATALFLYSYTQVDLSLTLSKLSIYQSIEKGFQYVGYYQRPVSATLYILLLVVFFLLYWLCIWAAYQKKISTKFFWWTVGVTTVILVFSYPAFSYDMFNYMFTAK